MTIHDNKASTGTCSHEELSAFADGECDAATAARVLAALDTDAALMQRWALLHAVGDALRSSEVGACHASGFAARVAVALEAEPTVLAPPRTRGGLRRYALPGLAVAASVAVLSWVAVPMLQAPGAATVARAPAAAVGTLAQVPAAVGGLVQAPAAAAGALAQAPAAAAAVAGLSSPATGAPARSFAAYMAAHRELGAGGGLSHPVAYMRAFGTAEDR